MRVPLLIAALAAASLPAPGQTPASPGPASPAPAATAVPQPIPAHLPAGFALPEHSINFRIRNALAAPIVRIVDKPAHSPTGDDRDYVSYGTYWWPDPSKPDGLPFIRRDGHRNLALTETGDEVRLAALTTNLEALALGWARQHREDCARQAAAWLRAWLVDPATRMTPAFDYAQIRMGHDRNRGSPSGLIEFRRIGAVADTVPLLHGAPGFTAADEATVRAWFADALAWLLESPNGRAEHKAPNNHGSWYLANVVEISHFLGRDAEAAALAREDFARIDAQVGPDGGQPLELARADSLSYSAFNLEAQMELSRVAIPLGVDPWNHRTPGGAGLHKALEYLRPYNANPKAWPHGQLASKEPGILNDLLAAAARLDQMAPAPAPGAP